MKPQIFFTAFIVSGVLLAACNAAPDQQTGTVNKPDKEGKLMVSMKTIDSANDLTILNNILGPKGDSAMRNINEEGQEVNLQDALKCIALFRPAMNAHGISDTLKAIRITKVFTRKITEVEEFGGRNLLTWMTNIAKTYDLNGKGKNLAFRLCFGIYTDEFLNKYLHDKPELMAQKKARITIFIVPFIYNKKPGSDAKVGSLIEDENSTAYELGGIEP